MGAENFGYDDPRDNVINFPAAGTYPTFSGIKTILDEIAKEPNEIGCDYFTTTAKCLRISRVREKMARRTATKGQDMKISPGFDQLRRANFCWARCARAERDSRSMRPRSDFNLRYCWMAVR